MRFLLLIPLAASAAGLAGCHAPADTGAAAFQVAQRDLTLQQADAPRVEVASPVELARAAPVEHRTTPRVRKDRRAARTAAPAPERPKPVLVDVPAPTPGLTSTAVPANPASYETPDPYALAPGQTVTVLPASAGAGSAPVSIDDEPADAQRGDSRGVSIRGGGHGGSCGGRGGHGGGPGFRGLR